MSGDALSGMDSRRFVRGSGDFARDLWLMGRTLVGKCLLDFNMSREDVLRRSMCVGRAGFNSNSELKTRNSQTRTPKMPVCERRAFYPPSRTFPVKYI